MLAVPSVMLIFASEFLFFENKIFWTAENPELFPIAYSMSCRYQAFAQTLQQSRGFGSEFRFPARPSGTAAATTEEGTFANAGGDDDDLYS